MFIKMEFMIQEALSNIEVLLARKASLIENLVNLVKDYARHEEATLVGVSNARSLVSQSKTLEDTNKATGLLDEAMHSIVGVVESYPELKADEGYLKLMNQLTLTEDKIAAYRENYNKIVQIYNQKVRVFPSLLIANLFNFSAGEFYDKDRKQSKE